MSFRNFTAGQIVVLVISLMGTLGAGAPVTAQDRHALVVGIDSYDNVSSLSKARNDARAVAETLEDAGFNTQLLIDVSGFDLLTQLSRFSQQLNPGDEVVFYFAGHGVEIEGQNYLLPADVPALGPGQELVIRRAGLPVEEIIAQFNSRGVRLSLLILDACRDNPFDTVGTRSLGGARGLRQEVPPEGTFIMFSAGAGQAALDRLSEDDPNPNSVFTRVLLPHLSEPGLPLRTMVREVRSEVRQLGRTVGHEQFPAVYDQLDGAFTFLPDDVDEAPAEDPGPQVIAPALADPCAAARADWSMIGETPTEPILQAFLQTHADCTLMVAMATHRLAVLAEADTVTRVVVPTLEPPSNQGESGGDGGGPGGGADIEIPRHIVLDTPPSYQTCDVGDPFHSSFLQLGQRGPETSLSSIHILCEQNTALWNGYTIQFNWSDMNNPTHVYSDCVRGAVGHTCWLTLPDDTHPLSVSTEQ